jgi:prevent-host-death family protein
MSAKEAKNGFGLMLDSALAEPVTVHKHGRPVVVVVAVEEFKRLKALAVPKRKKLQPVASKRLAVTDRQTRMGRITGGDTGRYSWKRFHQVKELRGS